MQEIYYIFIVIISELRVIVSGTISIFIQIDVFFWGGDTVNDVCDGQRKEPRLFLTLQIYSTL
jgi:hypothetical protein